MSTRPFLNCYNSADVRTTADRLGSPMFSADTMRWFGSRLSDFHLPGTLGTPTPYGNPGGEQVGYIITSDRTSFGDAPRGWMPRRYTISRDADGRDSITFDQISADDDNGPDAGLNGWHKSKARAQRAAHADLLARREAFESASVTL